MIDKEPNARRTETLDEHGIRRRTALSCMAAFAFSGFRIELVAVLILIVVFLTGLIMVIESSEV